MQPKDSSTVILVADDDPSILTLVRMQLSEDGFSVLTAQNGEDALRIHEEQDPDLVVLDLMLPGMSGFDVMRSIQERSTTPIVVLTARNNDADKVRGLDLGADDYLAKPFNPEELTARVRAVLRRSQQPEVHEQSTVHIRDLEIDLERRLVMRNDEVIPLTRTEWNLLQALVDHRGKVMLNGEILTKVWGPEYRDDLQYLRVWVSRLRRKLEPDRPDESVIRTYPGMGYMLEVAPESDPATEAAR